MRLRLLLTAAALILLPSAASMAQSLSSFESSLQQRGSLGDGDITIERHGTAASAIGAFSSQSGRHDPVNGYRIAVYSGKNQGARAEANAARNQFQELFPGVSTHLTYSEPYFTLLVGCFRDKEQALMLWGRIKSSFPKAYITSASIPYEEFTSAAE